MAQEFWAGNFQGFSEFSGMVIREFNNRCLNDPSCSLNHLIIRGRRLLICAFGFWAAFKFIF